MITLDYPQNRGDFTFCTLTYRVSKTEIKLLNFDVFSFSESWLQDQVDNSLIETLGYNLIRQDRQWNDTPLTTPKRGGGIGAFIKICHSYSTSHLQRHNRNCVDIECLWVEIHFEHCKHITLGVIYRPPSGDVSRFCEDLSVGCCIINSRIYGTLRIQKKNATEV